MELIFIITVVFLLIYFISKITEAQKHRERGLADLAKSKNNQTYKPRYPRDNTQRNISKYTDRTPSDEKKHTPNYQSEWKYVDIKMPIPKGYKIYQRDLKVAGITSYMENFMSFLNDGKGELSLIKEDDNPYDKNAIAITFNGRKLGYIPKEIAKQLKSNSKSLSIRIFKIGILEDESAGFISFDLLIEK